MQEENGTFYVSQITDGEIATGPRMRVNIVGMSREQAKKVRDALNFLLEPVFENSNRK